MDLPRTVPAVEYRNLLQQLSLRRELDPENEDLRCLMEAFLAIGVAAGAVTPSSVDPDDQIVATKDAQLVTNFPWDDGAIPVSADDAEFVAHVAEVTRIPE